MEHDNSWTHVAAKGRKKRQSSAVTAKHQNPPSRTITLAKLQEDCNGKTRTWQASECRKAAISILDRIQPDGGWQIRHAVCLGSGSFSRDNLECSRRSMWQFVVFADLVRELRKRTKGGMDVEMWAQEPEFTDMDKELLQCMEVKVLEVEKATRDVQPWDTEGRERTTTGALGLGPARDHLRPDTFLFEPFMDMNGQMVREILAADPALYIGSSIRGLLAKPGQIGELAKQFDLHHGKYYFPRFDEDPNALEGLSIYWKPDQDDA